MCFMSIVYCKKYRYVKKSNKKIILIGYEKLLNSKIIFFKPFLLIYLKREREKKCIEFKNQIKHIKP